MQEKEVEVERLPEDPQDSISCSEEKTDGSVHEPEDDASPAGIKPVRSRGRPNSRSASRSGSLARERSHNGYGVDELNPDPETGGPNATLSAQDDQDHFEVGWEGGDADPMCPRSMPTWRKWVIIGITSFGSFCV